MGRRAHQSVPEMLAMDYQDVMALYEATLWVIDRENEASRR